MQYISYKMNLSSQRMYTFRYKSNLYLKNQKCILILVNRKIYSLIWLPPFCVSLCIYICTSSTTQFSQMSTERDTFSMQVKLQVMVICLLKTECLSISYKNDYLDNYKHIIGETNRKLTIQIVCYPYISRWIKDKPCMHMLTTLEEQIFYIDSSFQQEFHETR